MTLNADIYYKNGKVGLPLLIIMPGISGDSTSFIAETKNRFANNNVFAVFLNMRGRNSSEGSADCSAREIYDIYNCIEYIKSNYSSIIDTSQIHILGYSGGGGNALACAAKFPDTFNSITSFFGISDYGKDVTDGWYQNGASAAQKTLLETWIGDNPTNVPNAYHARQNLIGITNYSEGHLYIFHDDEDAKVPLINSNNVKDALDTAMLTNYTYQISSAASIKRWLHGYPNSDDQPTLMFAEPVFMTDITNKKYSAWTIPASGTITVLGYIKTKRFSIWLGGLTEAAVGAGLDEVATVAYNTITGQYTITPLTGNMDVFVKQGSLIVSASITEETILTVS